MSKTLKLIFNTEDKTRTISIPSPKEPVDQDEVGTAMETIVSSGAFTDIVSAKKATLTETDTVLIYEA